MRKMRHKSVPKVESKTIIQNVGPEMFFLKARKSVPSIKNSRVFYRVSRNLCVCVGGRGGGVLVTQWLGLQIPTAMTWVQSLVGELRFFKPLSMTQKRKEREKERNLCGQKQPLEFQEQEKSPFLCLVLVIENEGGPRLKVDGLMACHLLVLCVWAKQKLAIWSSSLPYSCLLTFRSYSKFLTTSLSFASVKSYAHEYG